MKLVNYSLGNEYTLGIRQEEGILNVRELADAVGFGPVPDTIQKVIDGGQAAVETLARLLDAPESDRPNLTYLVEKEIVFGSCVPSPGKIICVGLNYRKHAIEAGAAIPQYPVLFSKFENAMAAHGETIRLPELAQEVDYEAELAIVIGKTAVNVRKEEALDYVLGYCNVNDLSARDLQNRTSQWLLGKSIDGFCPTGPYLVTADEVENPNELDIRLYLNGELRQHSNTRDMIFHCDEIIRYISSYMTLKPGDLILTGTPEGVIFGYPPDKKAWLKDEDEVTVEIEKLGKLVNRLKR